MKEVVRKNMMLVVCFWAIGLLWLFELKINDFETHASTLAVILLTVGILLIATAAGVYLMLYLNRAYKDYQEHTKDAGFWDFLMSETRTTFEFIDERTLQISEIASRKSNAYTEAFLATALLLMLFSGVASVSASILLITALIAETVQRLSYILIWRKEFYR